MTTANTCIWDYQVLTSDQPGFGDACEIIARLFAEREREFGFSSEIARPFIATKNVLSDPASALAPVIEGSRPMTILTTWSDLLTPVLEKAGFHFRPIDWPAGPFNCGVFSRDGSGQQTYVELVNEEAPEISPSHVLIAEDANGFAGGTIATVREDAAWLSVMCVCPGSPAGTGTSIWNALADDLESRGIRRLDLGTQTAERFYSRCGMRVTDRLISRLRWRSAPEGIVWNDLVMMTIDL